MSVSEPFSLLMSVYAGDRLGYVRRAVESNTIGQTLAPNQVVIVCDGPVPADIQDYLTHLARTTTNTLIVPLETNRGLARALNVGLAHCEHELVARADSDDVALPARFATMLPLFGAGTPHVDAAGSAIREFEGDETHPGQIRTLPEGGAELERFARFQSPLHHPSVVLRKSAVLAAGGWPEQAGRFEDYLLWERMLLHGARLHNISQPLVLYRVDSGAYARRGGGAMLRDEIRLQRRFRRDGFTTRTQYVRNVLVRAAYRLIPTAIRKGMYRTLVSLRNGRSVHAASDDAAPCQAGN